LLHSPSDFNFTSKTIGTLTLTHGATTGAESTETLAASADASNWGAAFSGTQNRVLTLTAPTDGTGAASLAPGDKVILTYSSANSVNPSTPGSYAIGITGAFGDTGTTTVNILSNDQVSIAAEVAQSLTFTISDNTIGFGTLSPSAARFATGDGVGSGSETEAHNFVVGTNAASGYTVTATGTTLTSGANTITAIGGSNSASSVGTEQFGLRLNASGGSGSVSAPYAAAGFALDSAAFPDQVASAGGASANTTYSARYIANITSNTEAGSLQFGNHLYRNGKLLAPSCIRLRIRYNSYMQKLLLALFITTAIVYGGSVVSVSALTISPVKLELEADPGQTIGGVFELHNEEGNARTLYVSYENFEPSGDLGTPRFVGRDSGLATWMTATPELVIEPDKRVSVPYTITVPADAKPGGYFAAIFYGGQNPNAVEGGEVAIGGKLGLLVLLRVRGDITEEGGINTFGTKDGSRFFTSLPISFGTQMTNRAVIVLCHGVHCQ
jgi:hypothetical protein